jgi:hypothetical protein
VKTPEVMNDGVNLKSLTGRGCVVPDPLVQRLGTLGDLRCGVSISSEVMN